MGLISQHDVIAFLPAIKQQDLLLRGVIESRALHYFPTYSSKGLEFRYYIDRLRSQAHSCQIESYAGGQLIAQTGLKL